MATSQDLSTGTYIRYNGDICLIIEWQHRTPGNLRAFYQAKMRNVKSGKLVENRFRSGEDVEIVRVDIKPLQYLYKENNTLVCMDNESFEQFYVEESFLGDSVKFLKEGNEITVAFDSDMVVNAEPPKSVELEITYTEPGLKGDTATRTLKQGTTETGAIVNIPLFVNSGEIVKIDPKTGEYLERVK
jgi:elongation factor P